MMPLFYEYLIFGGYPEVVLETDVEEKKMILKEIGDSYVKKDALEADIKSPEGYIKLFKILSMRAGNLLNFSALANQLNVSNKAIETCINLMKKAFHVCTISPFFNNMSKELRKQPKIYFTDLGLRNYFCNNFEPIGLRDDRGMLLENFVFRRLYDTYAIEDIQFWRTQKKHEVDFIVQQTFALEVKLSKSQFKEKKYHYFINRYPDIPLDVIHLDNAVVKRLSI
jgi:predicted AAA+ superfamily ATPase